MKYESRKLSELLVEIDKGMLLLPHLQRPFVWDEDQMELFMDSLLRGYPFQTLLFWKTAQGIKSRRFMSILEQDPELSRYYDEILSGEGEEKTLVLDGQQRMQTLYAVFRGGVRGDKSHQISRAYLQLRDTGSGPDDDGVLYQVEFHNDKSLDNGWFCIPDLFRKHKNIAQKLLLDEMTSQLSAFGWTEVEVGQALEKIKRLWDVLFGEEQIWISCLSDTTEKPYSYREIGSIFVRVNSGGTRLSAADLYFALLKEEWGEVEQLFEGVLSILDPKKIFDFDTKFCLSCLLALTGQPQSSDPQKLSANPNIIGQLKSVWSQAELGFKKLRDFLQNECLIHHPSLIRSYSSIIPLFCYLAERDATGNDNRDMKAYFYKSQLLKWFSSSTNARIDKLVGIVRGKASFPLQDIKAYFGNDCKLPVDLVIGDLGSIHRRINRVTYLHICYATKQNYSAHGVASERNLPHVDHIYPKTPLRGLGLDSSEIDHLGNFRFVEAAENWKKNAALPDKYFSPFLPDVRERHLLVDKYVKNPSLLLFTATDYQNFRDERLNEIWKIISSVVNR